MDWHDVPQSTHTAFLLTKQPSIVRAVRRTVLLDSRVLGDVLVRRRDLPHALSNAFNSFCSLWLSPKCMACAEPWSFCWWRLSPCR